MDWFQDVAHMLATDGKGVEWTSPTGLRVRQAYRVQERKVIRTLAGSTPFRSTSIALDARADAKLLLNKQVNSIAPNLVHSFDAAHMTKTLIGAKDRGLTDFVMVHDSFGCHAASMDEFISVIREKFVEIYTTDQFAALRDDFVAQAGPESNMANLPTPARGGFDIKEVATSPFFFA